jgi:hypothetical protein
MGGEGYFNLIQFHVTRTWGANAERIDSGNGDK